MMFHEIFPHYFSALKHTPLRYEDRRIVYSVHDLFIYLKQHGATSLNQKFQVQGIIKQVQPQQIGSKKGLKLWIESGSSSSESGSINIGLEVIFFNVIPWLKTILVVGKELRFYGEIQQNYYGNYVLQHPEVFAHNKPLSKSLDAVYPSQYGKHHHVKPAIFQKAVKESLKLLSNSLHQNKLHNSNNLKIQEFQEHLLDPLPSSWLEKLKLPCLATAFKTIHYPEFSDPKFSDQEQLEQLQEKNHPAWQRVILDELISQQLALQHSKNKRQQETSIPIGFNENKQKQNIAEFSQTIGFTLTNAQKRVIDEITQDLQYQYPMQRMLQGDVGSGKTAVAAFMALHVLQQGYQVAIMAPTEILAHQLYLKISSWFDVLQKNTEKSSASSTSSEFSTYPVHWLCSATKKKDKEKIYQSIAQPTPQIVIGTHALLQPTINFNCLALVIIDEQHRFGVEQRVLLRHQHEQNHAVHLLMMSATPIPRSLAMTYYADLSVSIIDELPPNRTPIQTSAIPVSQAHKCMERLEILFQKGQQAYWVCPLIEESEHEDFKKLSNANDRFITLENYFKPLGWKVELLHGQMKAAEKEAIMTRFKNNEFQLLVSTTVIEVGVDVPNSNVMVIENTERFGLAQLHQLRGRVGRGAEKSYCILLYQSPLSNIGKERLKIMQESQDGFVIAQADLQLRGPGELMGARQSGDNSLNFADLSKDEKWIEIATKIASTLLKNYPHIVQWYQEHWLYQTIDFLEG